MHRLFAAALAALVLLAPLTLAQDAPAEAPPALRFPVTGVDAPDTPAGRQLRWLLGALGGEDDPADPARYAEDFLQAVPLDRLRMLMEQLRAAQGWEVIRVEERDEHALRALTRANSDQSSWWIIVGVLEEEPHQIQTLLFQPAPQENVEALASWDELDRHLRELGEWHSTGVFRVADDNALEKIHVGGTDRRLAIGSTFKLWVLGALAERIGEGEASWDDTLPIREEFISLPSGEMQDLPIGTERPLSEYALKMISISDNTATDHLIHYLGRETVERWMAARHAFPELNFPFLTTREFFTIKLSDDHDLLHDYAAADPAQRREMLAGRVLEQSPNKLMAGAWLVPQEIGEIEWFASPQEVARTLADLDAMSREEGMEPLYAALSTNPGVPISEEAWPRRLYKGGSEPGVIALAWLLERRDGARFVLYLAVNDRDAQVDQNRVIGLAIRAVERLEREAAAGG